MKSCERLVLDGHISSDQPAKLLAQGYQRMQEFSGLKQRIIGSSTACVVILSHKDRMMYAANIGDSGFLVVRDGKIVHKSREQQHHFNTPFQLSLPPSELASEVLSDRPESADKYAFSVQNGDVIMLATD
ncbi:Phosphatase PTC7 -like protein, partial [Caligus rogercresseyi]